MFWHVSVHLSVHRGRVPRPGPDRGYHGQVQLGGGVAWPGPDSGTLARSRGGTTARSRWGYPGQVQMGVPQPSPDGGTPARSGLGGTPYEVWTEGYPSQGWVCLLSSYRRTFLLSISNNHNRNLSKSLWNTPEYLDPFNNWCLFLLISTNILIYSVVKITSWKHSLFHNILLNKKTQTFYELPRK